MAKPEVTVIDYGAGNLLSVRKALEHCGATVIVTGDPREIISASLVLLPGVGAFASAMKALDQLNLVSTIHRLSCLDIPILGICLGMQLLLEESEEFGITAGLGLIPGRVIPIFNREKSEGLLKIPHIGWNILSSPCIETEGLDPLFAKNLIGESFYFVHSFMAKPVNSKHIVAECDYGGYKIPAIIKQGKITGCQFHPEKSGEVGLDFLSQFIHQ